MLKLYWSVFCDFTLVLVSLLGISPISLVPIVWFVQSNSRTVPHNDPVVVDCQWFPYNRWVPVTVTYSVGEQAAWLTHDPDFLWYMSLAQNTAGPWFKLSVSSWDWTSQGPTRWWKRKQLGIQQPLFVQTQHMVHTRKEFVFGLNTVQLITDLIWWSNV